MTQDEMKKVAAAAAIELLPDGGVIGVGTGSTVNHFIDLLAKVKHRFDGAVSSSEASTARLKSHGIQVLDLNSCGDLEVYVDGADESNHYLQLIKGGGGALTREKIIAGASRKFICIADEGKLVDVLGAFPLPVEVIPMARSFVARQLVQAGRHAGVAPGLRDGQRQPDPRRAGSADHGAVEARGRPSTGSPAW